LAVATAEMLVHNLAGPTVAWLAEQMAALKAGLLVAWKVAHLAAYLVESLVELKAVLMVAWKVVRWVVASAGLLDHQSADP
jgi:uncharacterized protein YaaW (UPF0174 family)